MTEQAIQDKSVPAYLQGFGAGIAFTALVVLISEDSALSLALIIAGVCILTSFLLENHE